ncbi:unnamed protein product, partial [Parnassius apollo]
MHRLFAELELSLTVTEQNLADRVRYILRSNIFDVAELERLRCEAFPSSDENATAEDAAPQMVEQPANVDAAVNTPVVVDSNDDGTVARELELEHMRSTLEEAIVETRSTPLENRPRLPRIALSKRNRGVVRALNPMLVTYLEASRDLCETDSILFGAALAVCRIIGAKVSTAGRATGHSSAIPAWRRRIEERIAKARALIGRLICFRSGINRPRIVRTVRMAFAGTNVSLFQPDITQKLTERIDDLKQRIAAWGKRIRRYTERSTRFNQNRLFQSDRKRLYESLERPMVSGTGPAPNQADTVAFWRGLWSEPVNHSEGPWTEVVASQCAGVTPMDPVIITPDDVAEAVRRAPNWKSPGLDGLHHYWLKGFMVCHSVLVRQVQEALNQKSLPSLFTTGITHLVPKDQVKEILFWNSVIVFNGFSNILNLFNMNNFITTLFSYIVLIKAAQQQPVNILETIGQGLQKEISPIKQPIDETIAAIGSEKCANVKKILGVAYEQLEGVREPDLNALTVMVKTRASNLTYNISEAVDYITQARSYDPGHKLIIFVHGFTDDPTKESFLNISEAFLSKGEVCVMALDGSSLIRWLYLRSTTYVRFMGRKVGEVLASMVNKGTNASTIHMIGHSLGAHISGFAGKTLERLTGKRLGRISALDPAGPCFSHVSPELRLKNTDADFVDVIHTDSGVYGLKDSI